MNLQWILGAEVARQPRSRMPMQCVLSSPFRPHTGREPGYEAKRTRKGSGWLERLAALLLVGELRSEYHSNTAPTCQA